MCICTGVRRTGLEPDSAEISKIRSLAHARKPVPSRQRERYVEAKQRFKTALIIRLISLGIVLAAAAKSSNERICSSKEHYPRAPRERSQPTRHCFQM